MKRPDPEKQNIKSKWQSFDSTPYSPAAAVEVGDQSGRHDPGALPVREAVRVPGELHPLAREGTAKQAERATGEPNGDGEDPVPAERDTRVPECIC
jgi:hypothetical protein